MKKFMSGDVCKVEVSFYDTSWDFRYALFGKKKKKREEQPNKHWFTTSALISHQTFVSRRISRSPFHIMTCRKRTFRKWNMKCMCSAVQPLRNWMCILSTMVEIHKVFTNSFKILS